MLSTLRSKRESAADLEPKRLRVQPPLVEDCCLRARAAAPPRSLRCSASSNRAIECSRSRPARFEPSQSPPGRVERSQSSRAQVGHPVECDALLWGAYAHCKRLSSSEQCELCQLWARWGYATATDMCRTLHEDEKGELASAFRMRKAVYSPAPKARRNGPSVSSPKGSPTRGEGKISLRVDQPVEGCRVMTHAFFRSFEGDIDDKNVDMEFHWYRSSLRRACANTECPRNSGEAGVGNVLLLVAKIECVMCCRLGITREHSSFCSIDCFRLAWHSHKQLHEKYALLTAEDGGKQGDSALTVPWKSQLHNMDVFCPKREESWIEIHQEKYAVCLTVSG